MADTKPTTAEGPESKSEQRQACLGCGRPVVAPSDYPTRGAWWALTDAQRAAVCIVGTCTPPGGWPARVKALEAELHAANHRANLAEVEAIGHQHSEGHLASLVDELQAENAQLRIDYAEAIAPGNLGTDLGRELREPSFAAEYLKAQREDGAAEVKALRCRVKVDGHLSAAMNFVADDAEAEVEQLRARVQDLSAQLDGQRIAAEVAEDQAEREIERLRKAAVLARSHIHNLPASASAVAAVDALDAALAETEGA